MDGNASNGSVVPQKKIFIGIPVYGQWDGHSALCTMRLMAESRIPASLNFYPHMGDSLVSRARNHITRMFLESDCTHLLFIDSDLVFSIDQVARIISHDVDLIGGVYCKKSEGDVQVVCNAKANAEQRYEQGICEVNYVGTGFMCISRKVFEVMIQEFGKDIWYMLDPDHKTKEYDFWRVGMYEYPEGSAPFKRRYLSEDWYFCQKAQDVGFKVWMDMKCILKHSGNAVYPLSYQEKQLLERYKKVPDGTADGSVPSPAPEAVPVT